MSTEKVQCHYDVLNVERTADAGSIKKAHRKLALKYHPDKQVNSSNPDEAARMFRLVQEAYECLSDPQERQWYDEHRESILMGFKPGESDQNGLVPSFVVNIDGYHHPSCFSNNYTDDTGCFYQVYHDIFAKIDAGELRGWISQGNIEQHHAPRPVFGTSASEWKDVNNFYRMWEGFQSCLNFAWVDEYDTRDAPNRRYKRAMEDENSKARRKARRERNDDVLSLLHYVKKRDPRVKKHRVDVEKEKERKAEEVKQLAAQKKADAAAAREAWKIEQEKLMAEYEAEDLNAGRIRLADLDDDYDYGGKKNKKRGKKGKKKNRYVYDDNEEEPKEYVKTYRVPPAEPGEGDSIEGDEDGCEPAQPTADIADDVDDEEAMQQMNDVVIEEDFDDEESFSSSESSEEPEVWRCECCRKDFKSVGQMENHMKSKKHKEAFKKYEKRMKKKKQEEEAELFEMVDEIGDSM